MICEKSRGFGANVWDLIGNQIIFQLENTVDRVHGLVNHCGMAVYEHTVDHERWWPRARRSPALQPLWRGKPHRGLGKRQIRRWGTLPRVATGGSLEE
jgi:hypothetical protein